MKLLLALLLPLAFWGAGDPPGELLDKKWFFSYMRTDGRAQELPVKVPADRRPWVYFAKDGAYRQSMDGSTETGTWSYAEAQKTLTTTAMARSGNREVTALTLVRVTADSLELREPNGAVLGMVSK